jgi:NADP-dependent alcohol dehydrogenase
MYFGNTYNFESKKEKLAQFATRVWHINEGSIDEKAKLAITKTEAFFHSLGIHTKLSEYTENYKEAAPFIFKNFTARGMLGLGEHKNITPTDVVKIVEMSY